MRQPHDLPPSSLEYPTLTRSALAMAEGAATLLAPCLAILAPAARIAWASRARSSVGRAPPSHGGGQGFESPRVHILFVAICRLNAMIKRGCRHALGLLCSNPAERPVATASPRPPSRPILNESTPCSPAFVRITSLRTLAGFPFMPRSGFVCTLCHRYHPD